MEGKLTVPQRLAWWITSHVAEVEDFYDTVKMVKSGHAGITIDQGTIELQPNAKWFVEQSLIVIVDTCKIADIEKRSLTSEEMQYILRHLRHTVEDIEKRLETVQ